MKIFSYLLQLWIGIFEKIQFGKYASLSGRLGLCKYPKLVLVIQGEEDEQVSLENSLYSLKDEIINCKVEFLLVKNGGHYPTRVKKEKETVVEQEIFNKIHAFIGGRDETVY